MHCRKRKFDAYYKVIKTAVIVNPKVAETTGMDLINCVCYNHNCNAHKIHSCNNCVAIMVVVKCHKNKGENNNDHKNEQKQHETYPLIPKVYCSMKRKINQAYFLNEIS